jgi:hypothetical protein
MREGCLPADVAAGNVRARVVNIAAALIADAGAVHAER